MRHWHVLMIFCLSLTLLGTQVKAQDDLYEGTAPIEEPEYIDEEFLDEPEFAEDSEVLDEEDFEPLSQSESPLEQEEFIESEEIIEAADTGEEAFDLPSDMVDTNDTEEISLEEELISLEEPLEEKMDDTLLEADALPTPSASPGAYSIQQGDTLWDMAAHFYDNPYDWNRIWDANQDNIRNPHLIFPQQQVMIPGVGMVTVQATEEVMEEPMAMDDEEMISEPMPMEPMAEEPQEIEEALVEEEFVELVEEEVEPVSETEAVPESVPEVVDSPMVESVPKNRRPPRLKWGNDTFIADTKWEGDAQIIRDLEKKILISAHDIVFLNKGAANGIYPGMWGSIYRREQKVRDPKSRDVLGRMVRRVGTIQVTDMVGDNTATAVISTSREPIKLGDVVKLEDQ